MGIKQAALGILVFLFMVVAGPMVTWSQLPLGAKAATLSPAKKRVALGYFASESHLKLNEIPWRELTHIAHAFLQVDEQGALLPAPDIPNSRVTTEAHLQNVRVLLSLGGGKSITAFEKIATDPVRCQAYAEKIAAIVKEYDYDGVDIDWEFPRNDETKKGFRALAESIRTALDAMEAESIDSRHYELTAVISGNEYFGQWIDGDLLQEVFDHLHVMTYDMAGPWSRDAAHHAPLHPSPDDPERQWRSVEASIMYWVRRRQIPKEKLCIGIPLYGRLFPVQRPYLPLGPETKNKHQLLAFHELHELSRAGWNTQWDPDMNVPWLLAPDSKAVIAFDDRNSVRSKATWARTQGLGGIYFWALGQDRMADGTCWLVQEAVHAWPE